MKGFIKNFARRLSPSALAWIQGINFRRRANRLYREAGCFRVADIWLQTHAMVVADGPFKDMKYVSRAAGSVFLPKLIGSYEAEIQPFIQRAIADGYDRIIDIGCAEGYYAIGVALRLPGAQVLAYDLDPYARKLCRQMAAINGVQDRLTVAGECTPATLANKIRGRTLIVCDCEGYEGDLLDPQRIPQLLHADILVEFHDMFRPGVSEEVAKRFQPASPIEWVTTVGRDTSLYPSIAELSRADQAIAVNEMRHGTQNYAFIHRQD